MSMFPATSLRLAGAGFVIALLAAGPAAAADRALQDQDCQLRPQAERANCAREAAAARAAARKGELSGGGDSQYQANRIRRCDALPAAERESCVRRARGEGTVSGSVEGGGILREYREIILPPVSPPSAVTPQPAPLAQPLPVPPQPGLQPQAQPTPSPQPVPHPAPAGMMLQRAP